MRTTLYAFSLLALAISACREAAAPQPRAERSEAPERAAVTPAEAVPEGPAEAAPGRALPSARAQATEIEPEQPPSTVRVAAVQCYSRMGEIDYNRKLLSGLVRKAAAGGAKIVVLPECAVTGYMDPGRDVVWTAGAAGKGQLSLSGVAEPVPGPSTRHFAALAKELGIYLVVPLAEQGDGAFFNAQVLVDPRGEIVAHHRKRALWTPGDGTWVTEGDRPPQVVESPFGRLGHMICYDWNVMPRKLKEAGAQIVLYSVGWYGPNPENWYRTQFPQWCVIPHGFSVVASNWSADPGAPGWPGHGASCVIDGSGRVLAMSEETRGDDIVFADLPLPEVAAR